MVGRRGAALSVLLLVPLLFACAERTETMTQGSAQAEALPPPSLEATLARSTAAVAGELVRAGGATATLRIAEVLGGDLTPGTEVIVALPDSILGVADRANASGTWFLNETGDGYTVLPVDPGLWSPREVLRVLAGLPRVDAPPSSTELRELAAQVDAVVYADITSEDGVRGRAKVLKSLHGETPEELDVVAPSQSGAPGGPWRFHTGPVSAPAFLFLDREGRDWLVRNPSDPYLYLPGAVEDALK